MSKLLKEIDSEIGNIKFHKKEGYIDVAQTFIELDNGCIISAITSYENADWDITKSIYEVAVLNNKSEILELYNELEEDDLDNFNYRANNGNWTNLNYNQLIEKCKLVSKLIG